MKRIGLLAIAIVFAATWAAYADETPITGGQVDSTTLAAMGIPGLERISDAEGGQVRGSAFVFVRSFSYALGDVDSKSASSSGAPRFRATRASGGFSIGGFSYKASSRGYAFATAY